MSSRTRRIPSPARRTGFPGLLLAFAVVGSGCSAPAPTSPTPSASATAAPTAEASPDATPDPWAGYFDEAAREDITDFEAQYWGSFGDPGGVAPVRNEDQRLPAGDYAIEVRCDGPPELEVTLTDLEDSDLADPSVVPCPATTVFDVRLVEPGIVMLLDSARSPGAYLVRLSAVD